MCCRQATWWVFNTAAAPCRRALHRIVVDGTALSTGLTPMLEVVPNLRAGAVAGLARFAAPPRLQGKTTAGAYLWLRAAGAQPWGQF